MADGTFDNPWLVIDDGATLHAWDEDFDESTDPAESLAADQPGPNRVSLWVPTDATLVNLGADYPGSATVPPLDDGIAGRTRDHVHFHVTGSRAPSGAQGFQVASGEEASEIRRSTWVRLGAPISSAEAVPPHTAETLAWSAEPVFHNTWSGYSMLTRGGAVQESYLNHVISSTAGDLRLAGQNVVTMGSPRDVLIAVYGDKPMSDFMDNTPERPEDPGAPGRDKLYRDVVRAVSIATAPVSMILGVTYSNWQLQSGYNRAPNPGESGWQSIGVFDAIGTGLGYAAAALPVIFAATDPASDVPGANRLDLFSTGKVGIQAQQTLSISGTMYAGLTSPAAVLVSGGGFLGLSAQGYSKYSAGLLAIGAMFKMDFESQQGTLTMRARKDVELSSREGGIQIVGDKTLQINSNEEELWLFGRMGFYLGAGQAGRRPPSTNFSKIEYKWDEDGAGYGVFGDGKHVTVGNVLYAQIYSGKPAATLDQGFRLDDQALQLKKGTNEMHMEQTKLTLKRGDHELRMTDYMVTLDGSKIQIG